MSSPTNCQLQDITSLTAISNPKIVCLCSIDSTSSMSIRYTSSDISNALICLKLLLNIINWVQRRYIPVIRRLCWPNEQFQLDYVGIGQEFNYAELIICLVIIWSWRKKKICSWFRWVFRIISPSYFSVCKVSAIRYSWYGLLCFPK